MYTICSIWHIDRTLSGATTLGQSGVGSNGNEGVLSILQGWSLTIRLFNVIPKTLMGDTVSVFYSSSQLGL